MGQENFLDSLIPKGDTFGHIIKSRLHYSFFSKKIHKELRRFVLNLVLYLQKKIQDMPFLFVLFFKSLYLFEEKIRFELTRRLIWSRGQFGNRFAHLSLFIFVISIFLLGTVFKGGVTVAPTHSNSVLLSAANVLQDAKVVRTSVAAIRPSNKVTEYTVQEGDTLSTIGQKFGISSDSLRYSNSVVDTNSLKIGTKLNIPPIEGAVYSVKTGDTLSSIAGRFEVAQQAIVDFNYLLPPFELGVGDTLIIPDAAIPAPVSQNSSFAGNVSNIVQSFTTRVTGGTVGSGQFIVPASVLTISQYFSWYHSAIDIQSVGQVDFGLRASDSGTVEQVAFGWNSGYGNRVVINHGNGFKTTYNHLESINVTPGQSVDRGEWIGIMGNTGRSTGRHLHFEILRNGALVNPLDYL